MRTASSPQKSVGNSTLSLIEGIAVGTIVAVVLISLGLSLGKIANFGSSAAGATSTTAAATTTVVAETGLAAVGTYLAAEHITDEGYRLLMESLASHIMAYEMKPTADALREALGEYVPEVKEVMGNDKIDPGDPDQKWGVKAHRGCRSRASWGILVKGKEVMHLEWDGLHGEIECYTLKKVHLGSIGIVQSPGKIKPPESGRLPNCGCKF